ncbi:MAG: hypothetical protein IKG47_00640 [Oscillospiraceae bacterium]|nr:hypothetical protein [Clostridiales bacterium]MBR3353853.1 hypothetical protein [Oscillospiraceae bacterium]
MNEEEKTEEGRSVANEYELAGYKSFNRSQVLITILECLFCTGFVAAITFLVWHFNNARLMWWYVAAIICYGGIKVGGD